MQSKLTTKTDGNSLWHRMDARVKLIGVIINLVLLSWLAPVQAPLAFAISLLFLLSTGMPIHAWMRRLIGTAWFLLFFVAVLPWTVGSTDWYLGTSQHGIWLATGIFCKGMCSMAWVLFLTGTTSMEELLHAASQLGLPRPIMRVLIVTWHYVQVMYRTVEDFRVALLLRGFQSKASWQTYRTLTSVIGTLFVQGYDRTERLVQAMHLRGYQGTKIIMENPRIKLVEWLYLLILVNANCLLCLIAILIVPK